METKKNLDTLKEETQEMKKMPEELTDDILAEVSGGGEASAGILLLKESEAGAGRARILAEAIEGKGRTYL